MSRPSRASGRSGDPRKRSGPSSVASRSVDARGRDPRGRRRRVVVSIAAVGVAALVVGLSLVALRPGAAPAVDEQGRVHAEAACDLAARAGEAARAVQIDSRSRYAAATLLLDRAIIESARAAEADAALTDLDTVLRAVHSAAHAGEPRRWRAALDAAMAECGLSSP